MRRFLRTAPLIVSLAVLISLLSLRALTCTLPGSIDDYFISLTYARNLAEGQGFVYNAGGAPTDGFTSLSDVVLKALAIAVDSGEPIRSTWWLGQLVYLASVFASVPLAWCATRHLSPGSRAITMTVACVALALTPGLAEGATYLLESPLYLLALTLCVWSLHARVPDTAAAELLAITPFVLVAVTRPEGMALAFVALVLRASRERPARARVNRWMAPAVYLAFLAAYLGWRVATFGSWAPNSYYAKTSSVRLNEVADGARYFLASLEAPVGWILPTALVVVPVAASRGRWYSARGRRLYVELGLLAGAALAVTIWSGGDNYEGLRLLAAPTLLGLAAAAIGASYQRGRARAVHLAVLLASASSQILATPLPNAPRSPLAVLNRPWDAGAFPCEDFISRRLALALGDRLLAQRDLQCAAYFAEDLEVLDISGINAPRIAHRPHRGPVRHGRNAIEAALRCGAAAIHLDHLRVRGRPLTNHTVAELVDRPDVWARFSPLPLDPGHEREHLLADYATASLPDA